MNIRWILVPAGLAALAAPAAADGYSLHVVGNLQAAWTDNLFSQPAPDRESDFYYQIGPGAMLTYETPRTVHQLSLEFDAHLYQQHDNAYNIQGRTGWRGFFLMSPRSEAGASAQYSRGQLSALTMSGAASDGEIGDATAPAGDSEATYTSLDVGENYSFTPTRELRLTQGARGRSFSTETGAGASTSGIEVGLSGGADRGWKYTAVALQLSGSYVRMERGGAAEPPTEQVMGHSVLSWRRDFGPRWTSLIDAGVTTIVPIGETATDGELQVQPTVGGQISYAPNWGSAGLSLRRSVAPNFYLGRNTINDSAIVNAWLPLPWLTDDPLLPKLTVQGTLGAQRSQLLEDDGTILSGYDLFAGDVALNYVPKDGMVVALRGQHLRQLADEDAVMSTINSYHRTTVMVTFTGRFPDRLAADIPVRSSMRVDRSNNTPVGEEVQPATGNP